MQMTSPKVGGKVWGVNATQRCSDRVGDYVRFCPSYPVPVMAHLRRAHGLAARRRVADIGSGTRIFTRLLLENSDNVFAVEPHAQMRAAAGTKLCNGTFAKSLTT